LQNFLLDLPTVAPQWDRRDIAVVPDRKSGRIDIKIADQLSAPLSD